MTITMRTVGNPVYCMIMRVQLKWGYNSRKYISEYTYDNLTILSELSLEQFAWSH